MSLTIQGKLASEKDEQDNLTTKTIKIFTGLKVISKEKIGDTRTLSVPNSNS